jgi:hypothetical protein
LVRTPAYEQSVVLDVTYGEYQARCSCRKTFRTTPPNVEPRTPYDNTVRQAVLGRILDDGMSVERVLISMRRDFSLDLPDGFVYDRLGWQASRRRGVAPAGSGGAVGLGGSAWAGSRRRRADRTLDDRPSPVVRPEAGREHESRPVDGPPIVPSARHHMPRRDTDALPAMRP